MPRAIAVIATIAKSRATSFNETNISLALGEEAGSSSRLISD